MLFHPLVCTLLCLAMEGVCLVAKVSEWTLYTKCTENALITFFSVISPFEKNYRIISRLLKSKTFNFLGYYVMPATLKELNFIKENHETIPMRYMARIPRLQDTKHGREWLLDNLDKFKNSDLSFASLKPTLFTLKQQRSLLTFALEHQRTFMWDSGFCSKFPDLYVFDHGSLWQYLDPLCFTSLSDRLRSQAISILQKRAGNDANPTAVLFLIMFGVEIVWESVDIKQEELKTALKRYEEIFREEEDWDQLWEPYESLVINFKEHFSFEKHSIALPHVMILLTNYFSNNGERIHKETLKFMKDYELGDFNCYLINTLYGSLSNLKRQWKLTFELSCNWKEDFIKDRKYYTFIEQLPLNLYLEEWRKRITSLTSPDHASETDDEDLVYTNKMINEMLAVDDYAQGIKHLVENKSLGLDPFLKFDCKMIIEGDARKSLVFIVLKASVYQLALYNKPLPLLSREFKEAILMDKTVFITQNEPYLTELMNTICLDPENSSLEAVKNIIKFTRKSLEYFGLDFYYSLCDDTMIF